MDAELKALFKRRSAPSWVERETEAEGKTEQECNRTDTPYQKVGRKAKGTERERERETFFWK